MYKASVPQFQRMLNQLLVLLQKAESHAENRKIDPAVLLQSRLFPDMFPLIRQIQIGCDFAKGAAARLAGVEVPKFEDNEGSFNDIYQRIHATQKFIETLTPAQIESSAERDIQLSIAGNNLEFKGSDYLISFVLPNFYFHLTTAYAILRHNGVELGKRDFIGSV